MGKPPKLRPAAFWTNYYKLTIEILLFLKQPFYTFNTVLFIYKNNPNWKTNQ